MKKVILAALDQIFGQFLTIDFEQNCRGQNNLCFYSRYLVIYRLNKQIIKTIT